ncbi:BamA/TamA family outer membrane protein [Candidatus Ruminimicrobium bovinum]|uniref:BamA/TamA family outer membrane protein n=1 Tax=Candidatus Ruminimicrobium bovinum TaxID=3242779 RepID=UPI0039B8A04E
MKKISTILFFIIFIVSNNLFADSANTFFLVPFYTSDTSVGITFTDMLHFKKEENKFYSSLSMFALYTAKHQFVIGAVPSIYFDGDNYLLEGKLAYSNFLKRFYGIGNNSRKDDEEEYINRNHGFSIAFSKKIVKYLMVGVQYDLSDMTIQDTDDDGILQYIKTDGVISGAGFKVKFDTRNSNIYPTKGILFKADYLLYNNQLGSKYNYSKTKIDFRNYFYIYKSKVLFSYQIYGEFNNGKVPVQQLASLGGQNLLRGYLSGRYIDNILLAIQPEIKFKITNSLQLALFSGIGNVYENLESINLRKIQLASGVGLRIKVKNNPRINFRIDVAASNQSTGTYFTIMEAF